MRNTTPEEVHSTDLPDGSRKITVFGVEPPGLNVLLRQHWSARGRVKQNLTLAFVSKPGRKFSGPVTVEYTRSFFRRPLDHDNLSGSFKVVGDALVDSGILSGDTPELLTLVPDQSQRDKLTGAYFQVIIRPR